MLIEAKAESTREHIRYAIGQVLDYRRYLSSDPTLAVLLPTQPSPDMTDLLSALGVICICRELETFVELPAPG